MRLWPFKWVTDVLHAKYHEGYLTWVLPVMMHPRETGNLAVFERVYLPHRYSVPKILYIKQNNKKYFLVFDDEENKSDFESYSY